MVDVKSLVYKLCAMKAPRETWHPMVFSLNKCGCQLHTEDSYLLRFWKLRNSYYWCWWSFGPKISMTLLRWGLQLLKLFFRFCTCHHRLNIPFAHLRHLRGVPMAGIFRWQCCLHHLCQAQRLPWMQVWSKIPCWEPDAHKKDKLHGCELRQWFHAVW